MAISFTLNGVRQTVTAPAGTTLFDFLRSEELYSVKEGCDHGECGACSVLIDDMSFNACLVLIQTLEGRHVETLEGLNNNRDITSLQEAFLSHGAIQCGYCTPGMLISLEALRREGSQVTSERIKDALSGNLCRCTGYVKPIEAAADALGRDSA